MQPITTLSTPSLFTGAATTTLRTLEVGLEQLVGAELAGGLDDDIDADLLPRDSSRRGVLGERHRRAIDGEARPVDGDGALVATVDRVELE